MSSGQARASIHWQLRLLSERAAMLVNTAADDGMSVAGSIRIGCCRYSTFRKQLQLARFLAARAHVWHFMHSLPDIVSDALAVLQGRCFYKCACPAVPDQCACHLGGGPTSIDHSIIVMASPMSQFKPVKTADIEHTALRASAAAPAAKVEPTSPANRTTFL